MDIEAELAYWKDSYRDTGSEDTLSSILKVKYEYNHILGWELYSQIKAEAFRVRWEGW